MRSPLARVLIGVAAIAVVVVLFFALAGSDDDEGGSATTTTQATTQTTPEQGTAEQGPTGTTQPSGARPERQPASSVKRIVVRDGKPVGGVERLEYDSGDRVRFLVRSDDADEVHVHGYDLSKNVPAGGSVIFTFPADIEGVFEIELHQRHEQIAELRVNP